MLSHVLCSISIAHPLPLFFCPINLGIIIVCNVEGQPEEQGGRDCPCHLENSPGQAHCKERIKVITVPPALPPPPMVPSAAARTKKKTKKATAPAAPAAASYNASTATPTPSTAPAMKKGKQPARRKPPSPSTFPRCRCGRR